jgi:hypothetical protein
MISGGSPGICTVHSRSTKGAASAAKVVEAIDQVHMSSIPPQDPCAMRYRTWLCSFWSAGWPRCPRNRRPTGKLSTAKYGLEQRATLDVLENFLRRFLASAPAGQHRQDIGESNNVVSINIGLAVVAHAPVGQDLDQVFEADLVVLIDVSRA